MQAEELVRKAEELARKSAELAQQADTLLQEATRVTVASASGGGVARIETTVQQKM